VKRRIFVAGGAVQLNMPQLLGKWLLKWRMWYFDTATAMAVAWPVGYAELSGIGVNASRVFIISSQILTSSRHLFACLTGYYSAVQSNA